MPAWEWRLVVWLHPAIWFAWIFYWKISAVGVKQAVRQESPLQRIGHFAPIWAAAILFSLPHRFPYLSREIFPPSVTTYTSGFNRTRYVRRTGLEPGASSLRFK